MQFTRIDEEIKQKVETMQMFFDMATSITVSMNPNKVQTTHKNDRMSSAVEKAVDLQKKIEAEVVKNMEIKEAIIRQIQGIENIRYVQFLYKRFVQRKTMKEIADEMGITPQYTLEVQVKALAAFEKKYADVLQKADEERNGVRCQI